MRSTERTRQKPDSFQQGVRDQVAQRVKVHHSRATLQRSRTFGTAALTARQRFAWIFTRESLLRLGLAFVLSTALWLYVTSKQDPSKAWDYPYALGVTAENVRDGLGVANDLAMVHVSIQADRNITPVSQSSFHTFVDLNGLGPGVHWVKVQIAPDPGIQVVAIQPATIPVQIAPTTDRHVPVHWRIASRPPSGYGVGTISVSPDTVDVVGPEARVAQVAGAIVDLDLSAATSGLSGVYPISVVNSQGVMIAPRLISVQPGEVRVNVSISSPRDRTVPVIPTIKGQPKAGLGVLSVTSSPATVTLYGSPAEMNRTKSVLTAPLSVAGRGPGNVIRPLRIRLPHGVYANVYGVSVSVKVGPVTGVLYSRVKVTLQNLPVGLSASVQPSSVLVSMTGPSTGRVRDPVRAVLDLTGVGPNTYYLRPRLETPKGATVTGIDPAQVTVRVSAR